MEADRVIKLESEVAIFLLRIGPNGYPTKGYPNKYPVDNGRPINDAYFLMIVSY